MMRSVAAVLLFGLAVVLAQAPTSPKPDTVIVKKIYGTPPAGLVRGGFYPGAYPGYQQPYPYQGQYNQYYQQGYYNQYRGQYPGYYPGFVGPSAAPVYASPAPVYASPAPFPVTPAPFAKSPVPQVQYSGKTGVPDKDARIVQEDREVNFDGTFKYSYQTDNGIAVTAEGSLKPPQADSEGPIQVIQGSYTLYTPEGVPVQISYIADEQGYRASGDAIPTLAPEAAAAIAKSIAEGAGAPQKK
ncbi:endocuticle structural glycoprotein SgAbd-1-like [Planococcus citri]|uniref:endocuticle structural glycoprotein SgAbd-1-like n=1 Tax=Planococcus citri TaxID=170843 RepID=UPI0031F89651